jgi:hypothetical protein
VRPIIPARPVLSQPRAGPSWELTPSPRSHKCPGMSMLGGPHWTGASPNSPIAARLSLFRNTAVWGPFARKSRCATALWAQRIGHLPPAKQSTEFLGALPNRTLYPPNRATIWTSAQESRIRSFEHGRRHPSINPRCWFSLLSSLSSVLRATCVEDGAVNQDPMAGFFSPTVFPASDSTAAL